MRKLLVIASLLISLPLFGNNNAARALQSGSPNGERPLHEAGLLGQGEVVAVLDTGLDWDNCFFAEPDGSAPPVNTVTADGSLQSSNVDPFRRKVIAYDFLYSCVEYPAAPGCDAASSSDSWDNQGHGTHAAGAIAGDHGRVGLWDTNDAIAPAAKLIIQDAGYIGGDLCSQRPGLRCPVRDLRAVLQQAYDQGARIHSNSWGDRQGASPGEVPTTANYNDWTAQIDQFVHDHPDMLVVFNTGNGGQLGTSSLSSPGSAKNTLQVGGFIWYGEDPAVLYWSGSGPTRDGRLKPDLIAPGVVLAADSDFETGTENCNTSVQGGTSWSGPVVAGAAALVRQYYRDGYLHGGVPSEDGFNPSSALVKATLVAAANPADRFYDSDATHSIEPVPSFRQGFGMPVLDDVLYLKGDLESLWVSDIDSLVLRDGEASRYQFDVSGTQPLRAVLAWIDPPGAGSEQPADLPRLVNDLDLRVIGPDGEIHRGNAFLGPGPDRLNNLESVAIIAPSPGRYTVVVEGHAVRVGGAQGAALIVSGDLEQVVARRRALRRR